MNSWITIMLIYNAVRGMNLASFLPDEVFRWFNSLKTSIETLF